MDSLILALSHALTLAMLWGGLSFSSAAPAHAGDTAPVTYGAEVVSASCLGQWSGSYQHGPHVGVVDVELVSSGSGAGVKGSGWVDTPGGRVRVTFAGHVEGVSLWGSVYAPGWSGLLDVTCSASRLTGGLGQGSVDLHRP